MKKLLLISAIFLLVGSANSQTVVFNEVVPDPGNNSDEYIELFNTTGSTISLDCYTLVAYDFLSDGAWVYNLPNVSISNLGYLVLTSRKPVRYKCGTKDSTTFINWNTAVAGETSLCYYDRVGNTLDDATKVCGGPTSDFIPIAGGNSAAMAIMLFDGTGKLVNGFFTNNQGVLPVEVTSLANLTMALPSAGGCATSVNLQFSTISAPEAEVLTVTQAVGNNNNYFRDRDGFCGTWQKGQNCPTGNDPIGELTPGTKNSNLAPINTSTAITITAQQQACGGAGGGTQTLWNVGITITDATLLDATVNIYADQDHSNSFNAADGAAVATYTYTSAQVNTQVNYTNIPLDRGDGLIVQVVSASGCVQIVRVFSTPCIILPVNLKSFTAVRTGGYVALKWETMTEANNSGFAVERKTSSGWEQVAFIPSRALNGNSNSLLAYAYTDANAYKGVSLYRIRQIDFDNRSTTSVERAVRGENNKAQLLVYPNPSNNGMVNVVFEDGSAIRDVTLSDMAGRVVRQMKGITNNNIQFENLLPGVYSLRVVDRETSEQSVQKIVVNKR